MHNRKSAYIGTDYYVSSKQLTKELEIKDSFINERLDHHPYQLRDHSKKSLNHFESEVIKFPEVMDCYHMSGQ